MYNHNLHVLGTVRVAQKPSIIYTLHIVNRSLYSDKFSEHYNMVHHDWIQIHKNINNKIIYHTECPALKLTKSHECLI